MSRKRSVGDFLNPISSKTKRIKFMVLDIESKDGPTNFAGFTRPFMLGIYDGLDYKPFWNSIKVTEENYQDYWWKNGGCIDLSMREILTSKYSGYNIYAHNGGRFDYLFLLPWLMDTGRKLGFSFTIIPIASSIQVLDVRILDKICSKCSQENCENPKHPRNSHKRWRFLDSYKLLFISLNKAAKAFQLGEKLEHDLNIPEENRVDWLKYNKQDCMLTYDIMQRFHEYIEKKLGGEVGITSAATSMKLFRKKYLKVPIPRTKISHEFIRESYCGGRVEDFIKRGENLYYYDINSSYPAVMLNSMPTGKGVLWENSIPDRFDNDNYVGFVKCKIHVPEMNIAPLPVRIRDKDTELPVGKLIFPTGNLDGIWEFSEIKEAIKLGAKIESVEKGWWYKSSHLFEDYVNNLYFYRIPYSKDYDSGLSETCKRLLNSLYGKFAMKVLRTKIFVFDDPALPNGSELAFPNPECRIYYAKEEKDAEYIIPHIAARITALARIRLFRYMLDIEAKGGKVYYCDTDSIITDIQIETGSEMGGLKLEYAEHAGKLTGVFLGPKIYILTHGEFSEIKAKGFERRTQEVIKQVYMDNETVYDRKLQKIGAMVRKNFHSGPEMITVPKHIRNSIQKRVFDSDGNSRPHDIKMW